MYPPAIEVLALAFALGPDPAPHHRYPRTPKLLALIPRRFLRVLLSPHLCNRREKSDGYLVTLREAYRSRPNTYANLY